MSHNFKMLRKDNAMIIKCAVIAKNVTEIVK